MKTDITFVLDRSGSMSPVRDDVIGGFNTFLKEQREVPGEGFLTLVQFDHEYLPIYQAIPLREARELNHESYVPRGSTALLDAIGRSIIATGERLAAMPEHERPDQVLHVTFTDGLENHSREFTKAQIAEMITHQSEVYSWQFVYLGANQDAFAEAGSMGISRQSVSNYDAGQTVTAYTAMSSAVTDFRTSGEKQSDSFFQGKETVTPEKKKAAKR